MVNNRQALNEDQEYGYTAIDSDLTIQVMYLRGVDRARALELADAIVKQYGRHTDPAVFNGADWALMERTAAGLRALNG